MPKDRKVEATDVASPRSSPRKAGQKAMDKTTQELQVLVKNLEKLTQMIELQKSGNLGQIIIKMSSDGELMK